MHNIHLPCVRRRACVTGAFTLATGLPLVTRAQSDFYPSKPVHVVVPFPAGGIVDNVTRRLSAALSTILGQPLVVENRAGAGGSIGAAQVARAKADGYTLLTAFDTHAVNPLLYRLNFDSEKDLKPIALIVTSPLVLVVHPSVPVDSLHALVDLAKVKPNALHYASTGTGSSNHLTTELFKTISGTSFNHVPYKGGAPAITDVLGGQVHLMFVSISSVIAHIRAGRMRPLAVTSQQRVAALPDVPPVSDTYDGFEAQSWVGLLAPTGIPVSIVEKLNRGVNAALQSPEFQQFLDEQSLNPAGGTPEQFGAFMQTQTQKWREVIAQQNIKVE